MDRRSGHILRFEEMEAADDCAAVAQATGLAGPQPIELWCRSRKVARFEAERLTAAPLRRAV